MRLLISSALALGAVLALTACPAKSVPTAGSPSTTSEVSDMTSSQSGPGTNAPKGKRAAGEENEPMLAWRAFGNEPFWSARVEGDRLFFSTPDDPDGRVMNGRRVPSLIGFVYVGADGDKDFHLDISPGECSDGMSDTRYEHTAIFIYGDTTYRGCGEAAK